MSHPITAAADRSRAIPAQTGARLDAIRVALTTLGDESRRLERIGFELPLARCHEQRRYWSFLHALYSLPAGAATPALGGDEEWPCR